MRLRLSLSGGGRAHRANASRILLCAALGLVSSNPTPAVSHGLTPELVVMMMVAQLSRCEHDHPELTPFIESNIAAWSQRHARVWERAHADKDFISTVAAMRSDPRFGPHLEKENCLFQAAMLNDPDADNFLAD